MHDPLVVAFSIRRPWPRRTPLGGSARWSWGHGRGLGWRPSPFVTVAGRRFYFPGLITVWHREPGGADSGDVCKHWRTRKDGKRVRDRSWRWHVHHWRIQVHPLQALRRWALTRCSWCGGRSRRGDTVNLSHSWDGPRGRWWQGEPGLFHHWCSSAERAWNTCTCPDPLLTGGGDYGTCALCGRFRRWRLEPWAAKQAEDWRRDVAYGEHPTEEAYERAVATYQGAVEVRRVADQADEWSALASPPEVGER